MSDPKVEQLEKIMNAAAQYKQQKYRWVILVISACAMVLNGLLNNIIIPIASKLSDTYGYSAKIINVPIIISFLVFSLINIPVNHFLDRRGIKTGYMIGLSFYATGMFLVCFVNKAFPLLIIGYIIFSFGQPFILNLPAKIATYWFFPRNRALATSIMVGCNIVGSGLGFAIPSLAVQEQSTGQIAKNQVFSLYFGYTITTFMFLIINLVFLKSQPSAPPSSVFQKQEYSLKQTFVHIRKDKNLWKFFGCYWLIYGSFQTFASSANLLIKPFGASNLDISIAAICLIIFGATGAILGSIYLKKTRAFRRMFRFYTVGACVCIILLTIQLGTINSITLIKISVGILGFFITPIIPTSYELGCELAFPIGQAQVTGMLNGGSLIWAFISDSLLTLIIGFGSSRKSMFFMATLIVFIIMGNVLAFLVKVVLKRKQFEDSQTANESSSTRASEPQTPTRIIEMSTAEGNDSDGPTGNYATLQEQAL